MVTRKIVAVMQVFLLGYLITLGGCSTPRFLVGPKGTLSTVHEEMRESRRARASAETAQDQLTRIREGLERTVPEGRARKLELEVRQSEERAQESLDQAYNNMLTQCKKVLSTYERQATGLRWAAFGIAMTGAIAGAVFVPAFTTAPLANKAIIAGFGGVSGVANTAQITLREAGLTSEEILRVREDIRKNWNKAVKDYLDAKSKQDTIGQDNALIAGMVACTNYALYNPTVEVLPTGP